MEVEQKAKVCSFFFKAFPNHNTILVTLAKDEDESDDTYNKDINECSKEKITKIITEEAKKKPSVETDIRVKNYAQSLIPISVIRHRFRVRRQEEDVEDFLNYV